MSLYEIFSMFAKLPKKEDRAMTDSEFEAGLASWRALNLPDVKLPDGAR